MRLKPCEYMKLACAQTFCIILSLTKWRRRLTKAWTRDVIDGSKWNTKESFQNRLIFQAHVWQMLQLCECKQQKRWRQGLSAHHCRSHSRFESEIGLGYCPFHSNPVGLLGEFFGARNRLAIVIDHESIVPCMRLKVRQSWLQGPSLHGVGKLVHDLCCLIPNILQCASRMAHCFFMFLY